MKSEVSDAPESPMTKSERSFMVMVFDGDVPTQVVKAAYLAFSGVMSAWHEVSGELTPEGAFTEILGTNDDELMGQQRRRFSVLQLLYKDAPEDLRL